MPTADGMINLNENKIYDDEKNDFYSDVAALRLCRHRGGQPDGKSDDEAHRRVAYANVVLLALPDSVFVAGTVSDADGCFMLEASAPGEGLLRFSCLGYRSCTVPASGFTGEVTLREESVRLQGVEVVAERPVHQLKDGALLTRVEGTTLSQYRRINDMLAVLPGMTFTVSARWKCSAWALR